MFVISFVILYKIKKKSGKEAGKPGKVFHIQGIQVLHTINSVVQKSSRKLAVVVK